ncbi:hypothetical protein AYI69_g8024 [Smittium culicis]|uniref:Secreted protein n=1 Tax=Smittium culicis TaxID=133412 RepID=A0A1R1XMU6_9FUNG|nr:hypothetical protein AYI69_g8024 [Smittium culicis]
MNLLFTLLFLAYFAVSQDVQVSDILAKKVKSVLFNNNKGGWYTDCYRSGYRVAGKISCWNQGSGGISDDELVSSVSAFVKSVGNNQCVSTTIKYGENETDSIKCIVSTIFSPGELGASCRTPGVSRDTTCVIA